MKTKTEIRKTDYSVREVVDNRTEKINNDFNSAELQYSIDGLISENYINAREAKINHDDDLDTVNSWTAWHVDSHDYDVCIEFSTMLNTKINDSELFK